MAFQKHHFVKGQILTAAAMNEIEDGIKTLENANPAPAVSSVNGRTGAVNLSAGDVGALPNTTKIPSQTSDLSNNSGYITNATNDLINYYLKSETYTREDINRLFEQVPKFSVSVVSVLPTDNISETTIYLVGGGSSGDVYTEYIRVDGAWELLGSQRIDLTGYATEAWVTSKLGGYVSNDQLQSIINDALAQAANSGEFDGDDGVSPTVTITAITGGHRVSITDASGTKSFDVMNGAEISDTKLAEAIAAYIAENPIEGGVDEEQLAQAVETALQTAKDSGEFDGPQGPPGLNWRGEWVESVGYQKNDAVSRNGTSYVLVDSSFPSSEKPEEHPNSWAVLAQKGDSGVSGVYIGSTEPTDPSVNVWIDPGGEPSGYEEWVFTLSDGSTVTKRVVVLS